MDEWIDVGEWMDGWMDVGKWVNGWMDFRIDGWMEK